MPCCRISSGRPDWCLVSHQLAPSVTETTFICAASTWDMKGRPSCFWFLPLWLLFHLMSASYQTESLSSTDGFIVVRQRGRDSQGRLLTTGRFVLWLTGLIWRNLTVWQLHITAFYSSSLSKKNVIHLYVFKSLNSRKLPSGPDIRLWLLPQIFIGNQNHDTPELRSVGPFLTRFVRVYPERATNEGLGLRLELLGCELDGEWQTNAYPIWLIKLSIISFKIQQGRFNLIKIHEVFWYFLIF